MRFVCLHHTDWGQAHWDFMLEQHQSLATWKLYHDPTQLLEESLELFSIADHRKWYLAYEGPVSDSRGHVRRFDTGEYELLKKNSQLWQVRLNGQVLSGEFEIRLIEDDRWLCTHCR